MFLAIKGVKSLYGQWVIIYMAFYTDDKYRDCPMAKLQKIIGGKWKIFILFILDKETMRFGALQRELGDVTQSTLTKQLKELEQDGFILRHVYPEVPPRVEYSLSDLGKRFSPILIQMSDWGYKYLENDPNSLCFSSRDTS